MEVRDEFQSDQEEGPSTEDPENNVNQDPNLVILSTNAKDVLGNMESESDPDDPEPSIPEKVIRIASVTGAR